ncbi:MAG: ATP-binding cassette domain-containing protein [Holophagaceae bacterium]|jgi:molybdate transport system ATP-binding protein
MAILDLACRHEVGPFALEGVLKIHRPQLIYLSGENGCGKSTLLKIIAGHLHPGQGHLRIGSNLLLDTTRGINIKPEYRGVAWQSQEDSLFPHVSLEKNVSWWHRYPRGMELAQRLETEPYLDRLPGQLSGGQRALGLLARTLATPYEVVLLDEPLASLDDAKHELALRVIQSEVQRGRTIVMIVHHPERYESVVTLPRSVFKIELN